MDGLPLDSPAAVAVAHTVEFGVSSASRIAQRGSEANNFIFRNFLDARVDTLRLPLPIALQKWLKHRAALNRPGLERQDRPYFTHEYCDDPAIVVVSDALTAEAAYIYSLVLEGGGWRVAIDSAEQTMKLIRTPCLSNWARMPRRGPGAAD